MHPGIENIIILYLLQGKNIIHPMVQWEAQKCLQLGIKEEDMRKKSCMENSEKLSHPLLMVKTREVKMLKVGFEKWESIFSYINIHLILKLELQYIISRENIPYGGMNYKSWWN